MRTYRERTQSVSEKIKTMQHQRLRRRNIITGTCLIVGITVLSLILFLPYNNTPPDVSVYAGSPYYEVIQRLNEATYEKPEHENLYAQLTNAGGNLFSGITDGVMGMDKNGAMAPMEPAPDSSAEVEGSLTESNSGYVEVTDNQVAGVIEGDIIKRTSTHIFRLNQNYLTAYSIEGLDSKPVGEYHLTVSENIQYYSDNWEMFLSADGSTVTIVAPCLTIRDTKQEMVSIRTFDVSDPTKIRESGSYYISGNILSSRMVGDDLLVMTRYGFSAYRLEFTDETTFLPQLGTINDLHTFPADSILCPDEVTNTSYTTIVRLNAKTLEVKGTAALLSYSSETYVSQDHIFVTRSFTENNDLGLGKRVSVTMSEIACVGYSDGTLVKRGTVRVAGSIKNQYSMDEYQGILRLVTSTNSQVQREYDGMVSAELSAAVRNVNLYCVDLKNFEVVAKVEGFAPDGETAESVRFDGDTAYVCTAEVITLTDPVYFFDLRDLENITWKDTGTIDGYSSSLVNFGDGYLLGIGYNENRCLKIEIYRETETGVESVECFEMDAHFSEEYKSYFLDREQKLVGLGVFSYQSDYPEYLLLHFDGTKLMTVKQVALMGNLNEMRAILIDDYLYLFGNEFRVEPLS